MATKASVAVVFLFRRKEAQQLIWNLETDQIVPGQWIKATLVPDRCDLSPDGRYVLTFLIRWDRRGESWYALSRTPYFSALVWWHHYYNSCGSVLRSENDNLVIEIEEGLLALFQSLAPPHVQFMPTTAPGHFTTTDRLERRGWVKKSVDEEGRSVWEKFGKKVILRYSVANWKGTWSLNTISGITIKEWTPEGNDTQFLDLDHQGRVIYSDQGCLYAWENFPEAEPLLVADLNDNQYKPSSPPPEALQW